MLRVSAVALALLAGLVVPVAVAAGESIVRARDGALWFNQGSAARIARLGVDHRLTSFASGFTGPGSAELAWGSDGALWLTDPGAAGQVRRLTSSGQVSVFSAGIARDAVIGDITAGPDGALWFIEPGRDRIGRLTTGGQVTEFADGLTAGGQLAAITAGPDGAVWFAENTTVRIAGVDTDYGRIGRITSDGRVTLFAAGIAPRTHLADLTAGPDGALWFTNAKAYEGAPPLGRITTTGNVTEFSGATPDNIGPASPTAITAGPDRALWFVDDTQRIGRVSLRGVVREFPVLTTAAGDGIVAGPDGALWFPVGDALGRVARVTTHGELSAFPPLRRCRVPNLRGKTIAQIGLDQLLGDQHTGLEAGRCRLGRVTAHRSHGAARQQPLVAIAQTPRPGALTAYGTHVSLVLARARPENPRVCQPPSWSDAVASNAHVLVYKTIAGAQDSYAVTWRACVRPHGPGRVLYHGYAELGGQSLATQFALSGTNAAFVVDASSKGGGARLIDVFDVAHGRRLSTDTAGHERSGDPPGPGVLALVVNAKGDAAWLTHTATETAIFTHDSHGSRRLDHAGPTGIGNLRLTGNTLTWTHDGAPQTTTLG